MVSVPLCSTTVRRPGSCIRCMGKALDRMLTHQRGHGGWDGIGERHADLHPGVRGDAFRRHRHCGRPRHACTPARTRPRRHSTGIRCYVKARPAKTPYQKALLLWAGRQVDGLIDEEGRKKAAAELLAPYLLVGRRLVAAPFGAGRRYARLQGRQVRRQSGQRRLRHRLRRLCSSTGRCAGRRPAASSRYRVAENPSVRVGAWFTPTLNSYTKDNLTSNSGTAFAILALAACGELPAPKTPDKEKESDWPQFRGPGRAGALVGGACRLPGATVKT